MPRSRTVFLDIDGTILDHEQHLADSVVDAVRGARRNGHTVFVCTGRSRREIPASVVDIGFDGVISAGGGFVEHAGRLIAQYPMPRAELEHMLAFFHTHGVDHVLQGFDGVYPSPSEGAAGTIPDEGIAKATFFGKGQTYEIVRNGLAPRFHVLPASTPYLDDGGEVSMPGMNKGAAIVDLLQVLGHALADAVAIGDGSNDLEMLSTVGLGIAMGNAHEEVKAAADHVTTSVENDGIWHAFRVHGLL